jgi:hypothetical protein
MFDHLQACPHCPHYITDQDRCHIYNDTSWINRRGGCPTFPFREVPKQRGEYVNGKIVSGTQRPGQQKQRKPDRKYENRKSKAKYGSRSVA